MSLWLDGRVRVWVWVWVRGRVRVRVRVRARALRGVRSAAPGHGSSTRLSTVNRMRSRPGCLARDRGRVRVRVRVRVGVRGRVRAAALRLARAAVVEARALQRVD